MASREEIIKLWKDKSFSGSYAGLGTFHNALKIEKNIDIPQHKLLDILRSDEDFLLETKK